MTSERKLLAASILLLLLVVMTGCASTEAKLALGDVRDFARADVQRGLEIATAAGDQAGATCALAVLSAVDAATLPMQPAGAFSAFIAAREARRKLDGGLVPDAIHQACASVILDAEVTLAKLGLLAVPGGGLAGKFVR